jgi:hypothetical protein
MLLDILGRINGLRIDLHFDPVSAKETWKVCDLAAFSDVQEVEDVSSSWLW